MIPFKKSLFIFAGEPSGDLHGSHLLKTLKDLPSLKDYEFQGVAGPLMRKEGMVSFMTTEDFSVMGFSDVLLSLPSLIKKFYKIRNHILKENPEAVILIDYPGFNLRLASHLRKNGYHGKIVQYICPTVWAFGKKRIQVMENHLDLLLTIYPFEKKYFDHSTLQVKYVGHPLSHKIRNHIYKPLEINQSENLIAIFPGSREKEIKRNLPIILEGLKLFNSTSNELNVAISVANDKIQALIDNEIQASKSSKMHFSFIKKEYTYELMKMCHTAIAKSGTVTLELALHKKPTVVVYGLSTLNRWIAKFILRLKLPFYCIVNILQQREVFKELIENGFNPKNLAKTLRETQFNELTRNACIKSCFEIEKELEDNNPSEKAAKEIEKLLKC